MGYRYFPDWNNVEQLEERKKQLIEFGFRSGNQSMKPEIEKINQKILELKEKTL